MSGIDSQEAASKSGGDQPLHFSITAQPRRSSRSGSERDNEPQGRRSGSEPKRRCQSPELEIRFAYLPQPTNSIRALVSELTGADGSA